jgi:hypothetical protein
MSAEGDLHDYRHRVGLLRLEGLSRGPEAVARALDHAGSWMEWRLPEPIGRR